ncbi:MAG: YajG family lipoprotein [Pseudomonadales bacterium]
MKWFLSVCVAAVFLVGCANSPQQITLAPKTLHEGQNQGAGAAVNIMGIDARQELVVGSRGGTYKDTALITVGNDAGAALAAAVSSGLQEMGFVADAPAPVQLTVSLLDLRLTSPSQYYQSHLILNAGISVVAKKANETYKGSYKGMIDNKTLTSADAEDTSRLINSALDQAVARLFEDEALLHFIAN